MKRLILSSCIAFAAVGAAFAADPAVSAVTLDQNEASKVVTFSYTLENAAAIVTVDVLTNGVSIGEENVWSLSGDVNCLVQPGTQRTIRWKPNKSWPNHRFGSGVVSARIKAWAPSDPPDYMAVSLLDGAVRYYASEAAVPGGVTTCDTYRGDWMLFKRIHAANKPWTMGSNGVFEPCLTDSNREALHRVTLTNDFYIGVFEVTQQQWFDITGTTPSYFNAKPACWHRPVERVTYYQIRCKGLDGGSYDATCLYPNAPHAKSFLGKLRTKTGGMAFDLPSCSQWQYANRAGHPRSIWGDGSVISLTLVGSPTSEANGSCTNLNRLARYAYNGGLELTGTEGSRTIVTKDVPQSAPTSLGTAIVGSYAPNDFGLYDMHGNVGEWCIDFRTCSPNHFDEWGTPNANGTKTMAGEESNMIFYTYGGSYKDSAKTCRASANTNEIYGNTTRSESGFRVALTLP